MRSRPLPAPSPAAHSWFMSVRAVPTGPAACGLNVLRILLAPPSGRGPWGSFGPFGAALLEQAFQTQQGAAISGESGFSAGSGLFPLCLIWQRRSLACFDPHLMFGLFVACWWVRWRRGLAISPQPQGHKQGFVSGSGRWNGKGSDPSRAQGGNALEFEAIKMQIKALYSTYTLGTQAGL